MAETLSNINSFLAMQTNQSAIEGASEASSYSSEAVVIDSDSREYDQEIHFINGDNTYTGEFYTVSANGERVNILDIKLDTTDIDNKLTDVSTTIETNLRNLNIQLQNDINIAKNGAINASLSSSRNYTDNAINTKLLANVALITEVNTKLNTHTTNTSVHVKKDGTLQRGLNAEQLNGKTFNQILNESMLYTEQHITHIDCGRIE